MLALLCALLGTCAVAVMNPPPPITTPAPQSTGSAPDMATASPDPSAAPDAPSPESPPPADASALPPAPAVEPPNEMTPPQSAGQPDRVGPPAWQHYAVTAPPPDGKPTLSFIIDDMGVNLPQSARALALPGPLTLSWLPYASRLSEQVALGAARGDETMLHMPMEALGKLFPGPNALRTWLPPETNLAYLRAALDSVPGAVALNQHEGSVASLSVPLMDLVMAELKDRGMAFLDSLTIPHSVALRRAQAAGLPAIGRDIFIDNDPNPAAIRARLAEVEEVARRSGHAVAIGHPRQTTMDVMEQYLPTVAARGFVLWPVSATIAVQNRIQLSAAPAPR